MTFLNEKLYQFSLNLTVKWDQRPQFRINIVLKIFTSEFLENMLSPNLVSNKLIF